MMMTWHLEPVNHRRSWYWLYPISGSLSCTRNYFNHMGRWARNCELVRLSQFGAQQSTQCRQMTGNSRIRTCIYHNDVIMGAIASQISSLIIVYPIVYSDADWRKHQSSASLAFLRGIHRVPVNSPRKWPVTRKCFDLMTSSCYRKAQNDKF